MIPTDVNQPCALELNCRQFEALSESGEKVGEPSKALAAQLAAMQSHKDDTSCGIAEEGQAEGEMTPTGNGVGLELAPIGASKTGSANSV